MAFSMRYQFPLVLLNLFFCSVLFSQNEKVVLTTGHTDQVNCIQVSNDGKWLLSGGNDKQVKVWDLHTSKEYGTYSGSNGRLEKVCFSPNTQLVAGLNYNNQICVWNRTANKLLASHLNVNASNAFDFSEDGNFIYFLDNNYSITKASALNPDSKTSLESPFATKCKIMKGERTVLVYTVKGELQELQFPEGNVVRQMKIYNDGEPSQAHSSIKISSDGKYAAFSTFDQNIWIINLSNFSVHCNLKGKSLIPDLEFSKTEPEILFSVDPLNNTTRWNINAKKEELVKNISMYPPVCIAAHPNQNMIFLNLFKEIALCDAKDFKILKRFQPLAHRLFNLDYDHNGKYLATAGDDISIRIWNLKENRIENKVNGFFPLVFTPDGKNLITMYQNMSLSVWRSEDAYKIGELNCEYELQQVLCISKNGKFLAGAGYAGVIRIWDLESREMIARLTGHQGGIYGLDFSADNKFLVSSGMDNTVRVWDWKAKSELKKFENHSVIASDAKFSPDGKFLASCGWDKKINIYSCDNWQLIKSWEAHINIITGIAFSPDGKYLASSGGNNVVADADNKLKVWNVGNFDLKCEMKNETGMLNKFVFDEKETLIYSCGEDGFAKVWDYSQCKEQVAFVAAKNNQHLIFTPNHYYTCSKGVLDAVSFIKNGQIYSFDQFDIRYNRPDKIANALKKADADLITAYENACMKRIKRMGFKTDEQFTELSLPNTSIATSDIPLNTNIDKIKISVHFSDSAVLLDRYQIYLNGVPTLGLRGKEFTESKLKYLNFTLEIPLVNGKNKISISCFNKQGLESLQESFEVNASYTNSKPDLYIIGIGVSEYLQKDFNLKYPAKDVEDFSKLLNESVDKYAKVHTKILRNSEATIQNVKDLNAFLQNAGINDRLIVFIAGHGVLDEKLDYYFALYDIDFSKPSEKGLPFEMLEELLAACKANQKLLFMDTCHSGELDKDETEKKKETEKLSNDVAFRAVGNGVSLKNGVGTTNTLRLMEELFGNMKKGSGASVISSAGGAEYAMESDAWHNGLFTYALLNGIRNKSADANSDGKILLSELKKYTGDEVERLSNGAQKPSSRNENLDQDFTLD